MALAHIPSGRTSRQFAETPQAGNIRRILVGLPSGDGAEPLLAYAIALAQQHQARLTGLSIVDPTAAERREPVPLGAIWMARMQAENRLALSRERAREAIARFETRCRDAEIPYSIVHDEQEARQALKSAARSHDLVLLPTEEWFDHGTAKDKDPAQAVCAYAAASEEPVIAVGPVVREVRRAVFVHDGSSRAARTLKWLAHLRIWPDATVILIGSGKDGKAALPQAAEHCRALGVPVVVDPGPAPDRPFRLEDAGDLRPDMLVLGNTAALTERPRLRLFGKPASLNLGAAPCPVVLG